MWGNWIKLCKDTEEQYNATVIVEDQSVLSQTSDSGSQLIDTSIQDLSQYSNNQPQSVGGSAAVLHENEPKGNAERKSQYLNNSVQESVPEASDSFEERNLSTTNEVEESAPEAMSAELRMHQVQGKRRLFTLNYCNQEIIIPNKIRNEVRRTLSRKNENLTSFKSSSTSRNEIELQQI